MTKYIHSFPQVFGVSTSTVPQNAKSTEFLGCNAIYLEDIPTFRRNISPPSFGCNNKPHKKPEEVGVKQSEAYIPISAIHTQSNITAITSTIFKHR
jgi:hypothetical protein